MDNSSVLFGSEESGFGLESEGRWFPESAVSDGEEEVEAFPVATLVIKLL